MRVVLGLILSLISSIAFAQVSIPFPGPGRAPTSILTPVVTSLSGTSNASGATLALSPITVPVGTAIVACVTEFGTSSNGSMADGTNGAYTLVKAQSDASPTNVQAFIFLNSASLSGATITYTKVSSSNAAAITAIYSTNILPSGAVDSAVTAGTSSASANPPVINLTSGTPAVSNELFIGCTGGQGNGGSTLTFTPDTGHGWNTPPPFSLIPTAPSSAAGWIAGGYQVNSGTGTKIFNPSISSGSASRIADTIIIGLKP